MEHSTFRQELFIPCGPDLEGAQKITRPRLTYWQDAARRFVKHKIAMIALCLLILMILLALVGPHLQPYTFDEQDFMQINMPPSREHFFGTDEFGRDLFVRCWKGARVSLFIAFFTATINFFIGTIYGGISGFKGGSTDNAMMRIIDVMYSVPQMLWIILLMVVMGPGLRTMILALTITGWGFMARLVRGQILQLRETEYVQAAIALGANSKRIILKHLLPNCMGPIIVQVTFSIPVAIFAEAFLSYIGLGLPIPLASLGTLSNSGAQVMLMHPYQLVFPSVLICIIMLSFNLLGDGLRDALDPKMRT